MLKITKIKNVENLPVKGNITRTLDNRLVKFISDYLEIDLEKIYLIEMTDTEMIEEKTRTFYVEKDKALYMSDYVGSLYAQDRLEKILN